MKIPSVRQLLLASLVAVVGAVAAAPVPIRLEPHAELSGADIQALLGALRKAHDGDGPVELPEALREHDADVAPLWLAVWGAGRQLGVWQVSDQPLPKALATLAAQLRAKRETWGRRPVRLQLVVATSEGWIPQSGPFAWSAFVEGHDGVSGMVGGQRVYLPPSELIRTGAIGQFKPVPWFEKKFVFGLNLPLAREKIAGLAEELGIVGGEPVALRRFRAVSAVEDQNTAPRLLHKTTLEKPALTRESMEQSVRAGADYLRRSLRSNGSFLYEYLAFKGRPSKSRYNWPRHAGTAYSLALVGRVLGEERFTAAAQRALTRLVRQFRDGPGGSRCLFDKKRCYLGSSALGLLALAEYRIASGDERFDRAAAKLALYIKEMQRDDGLFYHQWYPESGIDRQAQKLYATQQAIFALARYASAVGDKSWLQLAERGMDYLAGDYWDHFLGNYFFIQEHWTCLAAEEMYAAFEKPAYAELCYNIGLFYDRILHNSGETPWPEDAGGMAFTHMMTPHTGGSATAAEATVSAVLLGDAEGLDTSALRRQLLETFGFLRGNQVTKSDTFWLPNPRHPVGGFYASGTKATIRIDTVQHAISALVRGLALLD